ncbi:MAG TPA: VWA domain-containing protein [Trebonia sp.]|jgi:magnesium chelatase subunit D|nr:VWA domain-containing protein [Trebonia sp.]
MSAVRSSATLPFTAIVGQDDARLALLLGAVDPGIGGVLLSGEKGTAKTTLVRALADLLPGITVVTGCRFSCDPAAPDPACPDGPHPTGAPAGYRPARLVELPLGATEDRVTGSLDVPRVLAGAATAEAFVPGLLALAHRGILYVDEINLLPDHLVDVLLDAAATGTAVVEREGVSLRHACRFLLVGTMNPEEGELRPQLLDRFGLCVPVVASADPAQRAAAVRARISHDLRPSVSVAAHEQAGKELSSRIAAAQARLGKVDLPDAELMRITSACATLGVDGLRGDLVTARAAIAHAAWRDDTVVTAADVREAARLALPHRRRRGPFDDPGMDQQRLDDALGGPDDVDGDDDTDPPPDGGSGPDGHDGPDGGRPDGDAGPPPRSGGGEDDARPRSDDAPAGRAPSSNGGQPPGSGPVPGGPRTLTAPEAAFEVRHLQAAGIGTANGGRRSRSRGAAGRPTTSVSTVSRPDLAPTVRAAALARPGRPFSATPSDLRRWLRRGRESNLVILLLDTSGSMAARRRSQTVSTVALSLLNDSYRRRDHVALLTFRGREATVVLPPTRSVQLASQRLADLPAGGTTPLAAGLDAVADLVRRERWRDPSRRPLLVVVTDGRATGGVDPVGRARSAARRLAGISGVVVDAEEGPVRVGLAAKLASDLGAELVTVAGLGSASQPSRMAAARTLAAVITAKEVA